MMNLSACPASHCPCPENACNFLVTFQYYSNSSYPARETTGMYAHIVQVLTEGQY